MRISDWSSDVCSSDLQPTPARLEADDIFAAPERKLAEPDLSGPLERLAQHDERFLGEIVGGHHEIGLFVIEHVDLVRVDELRQLEDRKSTRLNSSHSCATRMQSSACTKTTLSVASKRCSTFLCNEGHSQQCTH